MIPELSPYFEAQEKHSIGAKGFYHVSRFSSAVLSYKYSKISNLGGIQSLLGLAHGFRIIGPNISGM